MRYTLRLCCLVVVAGAVVGCATTKVSERTLEGRWLFAYIQKAPVAQPPRFDDIEFSVGNKVRLKSVGQKMDFEGTYELKDKELTWTFQPPDVQKPIEHHMTCSLSGWGKALTFNFEGLECVYMRPEAFYPNDIAGAWANNDKGREETMTLGADGSYLLEKSKVFGNYRLWPSRQGRVMSATIFIPEEGWFPVIWKYEMRKKTLKLTPISEGGVMDKEAVIWKLKEEKAGAEKNP